MTGQAECYVALPRGGKITQEDAWILIIPRQHWSSLVRYKAHVMVSLKEAFLEGPITFVSVEYQFCKVRPKSVCMN